MKIKNGITRRSLIKKAGAAAALTVGAPALIGIPANAQQKTLRILRWKNFIPASETWFNDVFIKQWGESNGVDVRVTNVGLGDINKLATEEVKAGQGHDLVLFVSPRAALEDHVIDHKEIIEECEAKFGTAHSFAQNSCFNRKTGKYHGFAESFYPPMITYRKDLWDRVGKVPNTWDDIRKGGRAIKLLHNATVGFSIGAEHNSEHTLRALLYSFGSTIQDADGRVALDSQQTQEALKFAKALYEEAMDKEVLSWGPSSNNQFMLSGNGNLTIDTMSIIRAAENKQIPVNNDLNLALLPEGPEGRIGPIFGLNTFVIWKFSENKETAKKFLVDYIGRFQESFQLGGFQNMPVYPQSVTNLEKLVTEDSAMPARYQPLLNVYDTSTNLGYPGNSNAAIDETMGAGIIPKMFARVVTGKSDAERATRDAVREIEPIFEKWRTAGKI
ncbi:MAG: ABC transporter substrate-binding protein [Granulosicoccus sp.]